MIPHQLQLKNFLSYGPELQTIDFTNHNLICLTGKNGHGKSALLDAITWAIWGQARKTSGNSKADAGILHLGQNHMMVILEFEVNGQNYRVRREYLQTKSKPFASLDFGIKQPDGKLIALTDKTIKDTQEKIDTTIGITYESFVNSTFLRQGQSNEFSKKSPKERKEILAEILQLQRFDEQKKIAIAYAKKLNQEYVARCSIQQRIEQELLDLATIPQLHQTVLEQLSGIDLQKKEAESIQKSLTEKKQLLLQNSKDHEFLQAQQANLTRELHATKQEITLIASAWHTAQKTIMALADRKSLEHETQQLQIAFNAQQVAFQKKLQFKEEYLLIKEKLTIATHAAQKDFEKQQHDVRILETQQEEQFKQIIREQQTQQINLQNILQETQRSKADMQTLQQSIKALQNELAHYLTTEEIFEKNKTLYQSLCAQGTYLKQHAIKLCQDIEKQSSQQCPTCPLCEQGLSEQHKHALQEKLSLELSQAHTNIEATKEHATLIKAELSTQHEHLKALKKQQELLMNLSTQEAQLVKQQEKLAALHKEQDVKIAALAKEQSDLQSLAEKTKTSILVITKQHQDLLLSPEFQAMHLILQNIENQAKQLSYNPTEHKNIEEKLAAMRKLLESDPASSDNQKHQADKKAQLFELFKRARSITDQLIIIQEKLQSYQFLHASEKELADEELNYTRAQTLLVSQHQALLVEKGSLEQKLQKQIALQEELCQLSKHIKSVQQELLDYQEIAKALGKDGIQALLIEQAIPEIEHETNLVLARLTNNQTQIFIESLRDLKKGGSRETLDIKISDQFGLRDYELFSGGEAFRIDFALRIGISKLLARRAGTTLQTIFIDEGFGSQDEEGLQLIMDNLYKIQDDFAKIIIVSHLPEMKEQFPVQFVVDKKRSGSVVSVVLQG